MEFFDDALLSRYLLDVNAERPGAVVQSGHKLVLRKAPDFDFQRYVREVHAGADGEIYDDRQSRALLGALYMPKNQDRLIETLGSGGTLQEDRHCRQELPA